MNTPSFKNQFDKITEAYINGKIKPYDTNFCFCGTLCDISDKWHNESYGGIYSKDIHVDYMYYTGSEYKEMEKALLVTIKQCTNNLCQASPNYEDALFEGMCAALEVLKQIHIERGENIEEQFEFKKRELQTV